MLILILIDVQYSQKAKISDPPPILATIWKTLHCILCPAHGQ